MKQLIAFILTIILWIVSVLLAAAGKPVLLLALFLLHLAETLIIGFKTGKEYGLSTAKTVTMSMLFGVLWWLPIRKTIKEDNPEDFEYSFAEPLREAPLPRIYDNEWTEEEITPSKNAIIIEEAPKLNYMHGYVNLPYYYPSEKYFARPDVAAIRETVAKNLDKLDKATSWKDKFRGREVIIKPNLVSVMNKAGNALDAVPQTTDPRVFEAVVSEFKALGCDITIAEGSGKGIPTMASFKSCGLDKVAKHYGCKLVAIEEEPLDHYYVPKAEVQKDVYIPRLFSKVISGEALYVSVPKMKTNLYTGVTLGFKNAMGTLSGNMRYRNHSWQIEKKLVDLLYLFQPDLTVVDGIIGGEGATPAPVDPVKVGLIVSGTNSVETDRLVTILMGVDPDELALTREADLRGFGDKNTPVYGPMHITPFRRAESSFSTERFRKNWPNVKMFVGFSNDRVPKVDNINNVDKDIAYQMEAGCRGGCLATMSMFMEMQLKAKNPPKRESVKFAAVMGEGCLVGKTRYWFGEDGKAYTLEDLHSVKSQFGQVVQVGNCSKNAYSVCNNHITACGNVGEVVLAMQKAAKRPAPIISIDNDNLFVIAPELLKKYFRVRKMILSGDVVEIPFDAWTDEVKPIPEDVLADKDWIKVEMPKQSRAQIRENLKLNKLVDI